MPLELDATKQQASEPEGALEDWSEVEAGLEAVVEDSDGTIKPIEEIAQDAIRTELTWREFPPGTKKLTATVTLSDEPPPFTQVQELRDRIAKLRVEKTAATEKLRAIEVEMAPLCQQLGELVAAHPDIVKPAPSVKLDAPIPEPAEAEAPDLAPQQEAAPTPAAEAVEPPAATEGSWRNAPIAVLKLSPAVERLLTHDNETKTVGQLRDYFDANGGLGGLEGITSKREEKVLAALITFVESQQ